jgi:superfamily II helicase
MISRQRSETQSKRDNYILAKYFLRKKYNVDNVTKKFILNWNEFNYSVVMNFQKIFLINNKIEQKKFVLSQNTKMQEKNHILLDFVVKCLKIMGIKINGENINNEFNEIEEKIFAVYNIIKNDKKVIKHLENILNKIDQLSQMAMIG